jgi:hypothetical protein
LSSASSSHFSAEFPTLDIGEFSAGNITDFRLRNPFPRTLLRLRYTDDSYAVISATIFPVRSAVFEASRRSGFLVGYFGDLRDDLGGIGGAFRSAGRMVCLSLVKARSVFEGGTDHPAARRILDR